MTGAAPPLAGVRVIDLANEVAEQAGRLLADLGAEVIKVEPPGGASARRIPPFTGDRQHDPEASLYWAAVAAGKRSVVLDLDSAGDRDRLRGLVAGADILVESSPPGTMHRLGLGYDALAALNPALIYVSVTPFGQDGPEALAPATELTVEAAACLAGMQGDADRPPVPIGYPQAWFHAGAQAAADALFALAERERSGRGQHLDVSAQATLISTLLAATGFPSVLGVDQPGTGGNRSAPVVANYAGWSPPTTAECADGVAIMGFGSGPTLTSMLTWMVHEGAIDPAEATADLSGWQIDVAAGRLPLEEVQRAVARIQEFVRGKRKVDLMAHACGTLTLLAPFYTTADLLADPQLKARNYWREVDGRPAAGAFAVLSKTPLAPPRPAPRLGADQHLLDTSTGPSPATASLHGSGGAAPNAVFAGLKVVDFTWAGVGPLSGKALADHGATVLKVESSKKPDLARWLQPSMGGELGTNRGFMFANYNTSKVSISVDLGTAAGRTIARRMCDWADVVLESFAPGAMTRMGIDYGTISATNPGVILLSTCLRGQTGPEATFRGYGQQGGALAGFSAVTGWPDRGPINPFGAYSDFITPRFGLSALAAAIRHRMRTGEGQHIDVSQVEASIRFIEPLVLDAAVNGRVAGVAGQRSDRYCPHGMYATAGDDRYVAIAVATAEQWRALRTLAPLEAFAGEELDALAARIARRDAIEAALRAWTRPQEDEALAARLKAAGVPAYTVRWPSGIHADPQLAHRGFFVEIEHPVLGCIPFDGIPTRYSRTPGRLRHRAPLLGEHTAMILREHLGYSDAEITAFRETGILV